MMGTGELLDLSLDECSNIRLTHFILKMVNTLGYWSSQKQRGLAMENIKQTCRICGKTFDSQCKFSYHLRIFHHLKFKEYFDKYIEPFPHKCPYCDNERKWDVTNYRKTCCRKECIGEERKEINPMHNPESVAKIAKTKEERYGDSGYNNHEKTVKTCRDNWNVDNVFQREDIKEKCKKLHLERRGVDNPAKAEECKRKSEETCEKKWGKKHYLETQDSIEKRIRYNREHHGCDWFVQTSEFAAKRMTKLEYKGLFFDTKLEINFFKFCEENNLKVTYHPFTLEYYDDNNKRHFYFVDFLVEDKILVETKGKHLIDENGNLQLVFTKGLSEEEIKRRKMVLKCKQQCMETNNVIVFTDENQFNQLLTMVQKG